jgi:DNA adenine methylase
MEQKILLEVMEKKDYPIRSPLRFPGSKFQAIKYIKPFWEAVEHDEYREPFLGGGAVFFAKPKVKYNWINDISSDLITTFKVIAHPEKRDLLIKKLSTESFPTKERHSQVKLLKSKNGIDTAHRYFYLNRTSYSGIMKKPAWGFHPTKSVPPKKWADRINIAGMKLEDVKITNLDFEDIIKAPPEGKKVLLFVDPPYYKADQKRAYEHSFTKEEHLRVAKVLMNTKHKFILTYDNCEEIKNLYSWINVYPVSWRYHTANSNKAGRKMGNELIITNFKVDESALNWDNH